MPLGLALLSAAFPPERRGAAIGIFSADHRHRGRQRPAGRRRRRRGHQLGVDLLAQRADRRWSRSRSCSRACEESRGPDADLDIRGLALVTGAALGIVWGLVRGNAAGWGSPEVVASLAAGVLLVAAFVAWELRARAPMLPLSLFRSRAFSAGNAAIFFTFAALFCAVFFYAQLLQIGLGYGPLDAGLRLMPWTATFITVAPVAGALADRIGERPLMVAGLLLQATGMAWLALIADPSMAYSRAARRRSSSPASASRWRSRPRRTRWSARSPAEAVGKAAGVNSMMRELGGVFGIAVVVAVFAGAGGYASPRDVHRRLRRRRSASAPCSRWPARSPRSRCRPRNRSPSSRRPDNEAGHGALQGQARSRGGERGSSSAPSTRSSQRTAPPGLRYATFRLEDGVSFVHVATVEDEQQPAGGGRGLRALPGRRPRPLREPPVVTELHEVGSYRP